MNATQLARILADAFEAERIEYAIGGAIAAGYWGSPRGTLDVGATTYLPPSEFDRLVRVLKAAGCDLDPEAARASLAQNGFFKAGNSGIRIDIYFPDIDLYDEAYRRRQEVNLEGKPAWVWSAEAIVAFKLMYFRPKDLVDVERIWERQRGHFDESFVRNWLVQAVGPDDERVRWWGSIVARGGSV